MKRDLCDRVQIMRETRGLAVCNENITTLAVCAFLTVQSGTAWLDINRKCGVRNIDKSESQYLYRRVLPKIYLTDLFNVTHARLIVIEEQT